MAIEKNTSTFLKIYLIWWIVVFALALIARHHDKVTQRTPKPAHEVVIKSKDEISVQDWYDAYNEVYFLNGLPKATVVFGNPGIDNMGVTFLGQGGLYIIISHEWNPAPKEVQITLLHEMCHAELIHTPMFDPHGPEWHACMRRIANEGAFDDLW